MPKPAAISSSELPEEPRGEWIAGRYEATVAVLSVGLGVLAALVASHSAAAEIHEEFYATIA